MTPCMYRLQLNACPPRRQVADVRPLGRPMEHQTTCRCDIIVYISISREIYADVCVR